MGGCTSKDKTVLENAEGCVEYFSFSFFFSFFTGNRKICCCCLCVVFDDWLMNFWRVIRLGSVYSAVCLMALKRYCLVNVLITRKTILSQA